MNGRALLGTLALVLLALLVWELRWVLLVLFGAVVLAVALDVPVSLLRRRLPLNRPSAVALVIVTLVVVGWKVSELLLPELLQQANQFTQLLPVLLERLGDLAGGSMAFRSFEERLLELATWDKLQPLGTQLLGVAGGAANSTIQILLMVLLAILLALDPRHHQRLVLAATPQFWREQMRSLLRESRDALGGWLAGMTISAVAVFLLTWAGLALLRVPLALLSGLVCGLLTFVPTIGPTVATALPLAVALLISPAKVAQVLILRLLLQNIEAFVLTPLLLSRTVNLLPTVALMAQLSLGALLGLPGVLLGLPLVVVLQVIFQRVLVEQVMDRWT
ncbi:AI-2E family transporter [Synechococcus sp. Cruz-9H2]|uniref:AI-2E family transporter n=1 Tax=unclassified Synechococcus TaxID=2626047 RepID=UPI0020CF180C|nr:MULTISPECIES: AI-2E family transporter [unclassified Synechococcus]MCP9817957.1 AI-2E family transporter [Synechococcus sp. Cruz-9H2]MCP9842543.1 AI-2E family transporter [Synechococcus sp. Edmonson 11F2]MCP9854353.1 AI-2E family transporter [Synechococcus sp. Cruz-9C9]MCP9861951.1 AI-2E family transporter [Synechococcus sp. Cruz-7E5]MCP9868865.1 AI-2E family transporter [Synechococcus sp. Cruz-7B9]